MSIPEAFRLNLTDALGIASGSTAAEIVRRADLLRRATRGLPQGDGAPPSADAFHRVEVTSDGGARHWVRSAGEEDWRPVSREEFDDSFDPHGAKVEVGPRPPVAQPCHLSYGSAELALGDIADMLRLPRSLTPDAIAKGVQSILRTKNDAITDIAREKAEREDRLRSKNNLLDARLLQSSEDNKALGARINQLREALSPFAKEARLWGADAGNSFRDDSIPLSLNMGPSATVPLALHISDFFNAAHETRDGDPLEGEVEYFGGAPVVSPMPGLVVCDPVVYDGANPEPRHPQRPEAHGVKGTWFDSVERRLRILEWGELDVVRCGPPGSDEEKIRQLKDELMSMHERRRGLIAERDHALSDVRRLQGAVARLTEMGEGLHCRANHFEGRCNGASNEADGRSFSDILSRARACDTLRLEAEARLWTAIRGYGYSSPPGTECKRDDEVAAVTVAMEELVAASRRNPLGHDVVSDATSSRS